MKINKKALMLPGVLLLALIWAYIIMEKGLAVFNWLDLVIITLIVVLGIITLVQEIMK